MVLLLMVVDTATVTAETLVAAVVVNCGGNNGHGNSGNPGGGGNSGNPGGPGNSGNTGGSSSAIGVNFSGEVSR